MAGFHTPKPVHGKLAQFAALLFALLVFAWVYPAFAASDSTVPANTCIQCHAAKQTGFIAPHAFGANDCAICHAGNDQDATLDGSHAGLIAFPGNLSNAERACGACHADRVASVTGNLMHTGHGIVDVTRKLVDGHTGAAGTVNLQSLSHGVADSMLRKLCASCHIGQEKTEHRLDPTRDRGGGCLACHINDYPADSHAALTTKVSDARCFGCHSRSGRISLSFAGLAEILPPSPDATTGTLRLEDGRHVERLPADVHYQAGMSCTDCHTSVGLMGAAGDALHQRDAVDIACTDCHDHRDQTSKHGTPLTHIDFRDAAAWLQTKNTGERLNIPRVDDATYGHSEDHQDLTCAACHSQWAPQCFGCHMTYDADGQQWDHVDREVTPGRWTEERWDVQNGLPALGVNDSGQIDIFVPGMIMTVAHPELEDDKFVRVFAPLSPHTVGKARSCASCHRSTAALGLGQGRLIETDGELRFEPDREALQDGLPADAWTNMDSSEGGGVPVPGQRPLSRDEMLRIIDADIGQAGGSSSP